MTKPTLKVILADIAPRNASKRELKERMEELQNLVATYGGLVVVKRVQKRDIPDYETFIGKGKLEELHRTGEALGANLLIIGNILKPAQVYHINEYFVKEKSSIEAWDRVDLILKIFALHATTPESRLQIELAAIGHMGPRIRGMGMELSRQGGGGGGGGGGSRRGLGETNTEIMRRHLRDQEIAIRKELKKYEKMRVEHRKARARKNLPTVGIVGYTNAGKSHLSHTLTKKDILVADKLFATLTTSVGKMSLQYEDKWHDVLVNDTIGFIRDLPPDLIEAFSSTLEESVQSDILLQVIDGSDIAFERKLQVVDETLASIGATQPRLLVVNKIDAMSEYRKRIVKKFFRGRDDVFYVSAKTGDGLELLKKRLSTFFFA